MFANEFRHHHMEFAMPLDHRSTRRDFVRISATTSAGALVAGLGSTATAGEKDAHPSNGAVGDEGVSPPEDLMREHGVLKRLLLVFAESVSRIDGKQDLPVEALRDAAQLIRSFVEDYHEHLEEDFLFPRFRKANKLVDLVNVLKAQHDAGRRATDVILRYANVKALKEPDDRAKLADAMKQFVRMYNPHEAREDTVLFPAFRTIVSKNEFDSLGEDFEKEEDKRFGQDGFFKVVDQVADIENKFGIYELSQFTPK
jgi:hemerythrin-like domain-containing protein